MVLTISIISHPVAFTKALLTPSLALLPPTRPGNHPVTFTKALLTPSLLPPTYASCLDFAESGVHRPVNRFIVPNCQEPSEPKIFLTK